MPSNCSRFVQGHFFCCDFSLQALLLIFLVIPLDIWSLIFQSLDPCLPDLLILGQVSKIFKTASDHILSLQFTTQLQTEEFYVKKLILLPSFRSLKIERNSLMNDFYL